jgi:hypothetical protein
LGDLGSETGGFGAVYRRFQGPEPSGCGTEAVDELLDQLLDQLLGQLLDQLLDLSLERRVAGSGARSIWFDRIQFALGRLCVDKDGDFGGYMRKYA